jgi:hypothetical protein
MKRLVGSIGLVLIASLAFAQRPGVDTTQYAYSPLGHVPVLQKKSEADQIADATKAHDAAKANYLKNPKAPKLKALYVKATLALADLHMNAQVESRKVRYEKALNFYREVVKVDPSNQQATKNRDMIVSIYKSMGKPVPGGG